METRQVAPLHAGAVIDNRDRPLCWIGSESDQGSAGVERVGHDLGENGFFHRAGIGVAQIFQEMQQVYASFTHDGSPSEHFGSVLHDKITRVTSCARDAIIARRNSSL